MPADYGEGPKSENGELISTNRLVEQDPVIADFWNNFMETASAIPQGFGSVSWPVRMLENFQSSIVDWRASKYYPNDTLPKLIKFIGEKLEPQYDSLQRIKTAYQIIGYEYLKTQPKGGDGWNEDASTVRTNSKMQMIIKRISILSD